jgi:peroxiredoxin
LAASAESYEQHTKRFIETFGNPYKYVDALRHIARALQDRDPAASLSYAQKALAFIQETWATTDEFDDRIRVVFWPSMIRAYGIQKNWAAARKIGDVLVREIDSGSLEPSVLAGLGEVEIRRDYALALEQTDAIEQAREQLAWAASLNKKFKTEFDSFDARHPLKTAEAARFKTLVSARRAEVLGKQELQVKKALLATETRKPAAGFKLQNLDGKYVSLAEFRGRTLILAFWATWCVPCKGELEEFGIAFKKHKSNPKISFAAVSIDTDKALVAPFAKKNAYQFPILLSDGKIEEPYQTQSIPKLYVIDGAGRIRFLLNGYIEDGYFLKKLNWMIAAASK